MLDLLDTSDKTVEKPIDHALALLLLLSQLQRRLDGPALAQKLGGVEVASDFAGALTYWRVAAAGHRCGLHDRLWYLVLCVCTLCKLWRETHRRKEEHLHCRPLFDLVVQDRGGCQREQKQRNTRLINIPIESHDCAALESSPIRRKRLTTSEEKPRFAF